MDFKKLYFTLFNTLSDAVEHINTHDYEEARLLLIHAQQEAEECYITSASNHAAAAGRTRNGAASQPLTGSPGHGGLFKRGVTQPCCRRGCSASTPAIVLEQPRPGLLARTAGPSPRCRRASAPHSGWPWRGRPHLTPPSASASMNIYANAGPQPVMAQPASIRCSGTGSTMPASAMSAQNAARSSSVTRAFAQ